MEEKIGGNFLANTSRNSLEAIIQTRNLIDIPPYNGKIHVEYQENWYPQYQRDTR